MHCSLYLAACGYDSGHNRKAPLGRHTLPDTWAQCGCKHIVRLRRWAGPGSSIGPGMRKQCASKQLPWLEMGGQKEGGEMSQWEGREQAGPCMGQLGGARIQPLEQSLTLIPGQG